MMLLDERPKDHVLVDTRVYRVNAHLICGVTVVPSKPLVTESILQKNNRKRRPDTS